jgi:hypothetical protein
LSLEDLEEMKNLRRTRSSDEKKDDEQSTNCIAWFYCSIFSDALHIE